MTITFTVSGYKMAICNLVGFYCIAMGACFEIVVTLQIFIDFEIFYTFLLYIIRGTTLSLKIVNCGNFIAGFLYH